VYIVVCRGPNCRARGAMPLRRRLARLLKDDAEVCLLGYACFGQCDDGPNVALFPAGEWYGGLSAPDDAERVICHARGIEPGLTTQLQLPQVERELHLRNICELIKMREQDRARPRRWWWPF
jgi:(2Fe-2S) ferredoxin